MAHQSAIEASRGSPTLHRVSRSQAAVGLGPSHSQSSWRLRCRGVSLVLALCGTGRGPATLERLRLWERLYAVFDADAAGQEATTKLAAIFGSRLLQVQLPAGIEDPGDPAPLPEGRALFQDAAIDSR
jgi:hypothetical protein